MFSPETEGRIIARKQISEIRREEIIEAFYSVVAERGLSSATTRQIAEAAGCSLGMLHHYFVNKEAMILAVVDYTVKKYVTQLQEELSTFESVSSRLRYLISWYSEIDAFDLKWFINLTEFRSLARTNQAVADALRAFFLIAKNLLIEQIKEGIESKEFREVDPVIVSNLILGSLEGAVALWLIDSGSTPLAAIGEEMERLYLDYLTAEKSLS